MIDLQVGLWHLLDIDETFAAILCNQCIFDLFRESRSSVELSHTNDFGVGKSIGGDFAPIAASDADALNRNAMLFDITHRSWRMVVAVSFLQFFGRDLAVLQQVINDRLGTFGCNRSTEFYELFGKVLGRQHRFKRASARTLHDGVLPWAWCHTRQRALVRDKVTLRFPLRGPARWLGSSVRLRVQCE